MPSGPRSRSSGNDVIAVGMSGASITAAGLAFNAANVDRIVVVANGGNDRVAIAQPPQVGVEQEPRLIHSDDRQRDDQAGGRVEDRLGRDHLGDRRRGHQQTEQQALLAFLAGGRDVQVERQEIET
jgi:hypothetical protein